MAPRYALSESESDPDAEEAPAAPSGKTLEKALRDAVAAVYKSKKMEELTIKRIRLAAAKRLDLDEGFFKSSDWKGRSEQVIKDEVVGLYWNESTVDCYGEVGGLWFDLKGWTDMFPYRFLGSTRQSGSGFRAWGR